MRVLRGVARLPRLRTLVLDDNGFCSARRGRRHTLVYFCVKTLEPERCNRSANAGRRRLLLRQARPRPHLLSHLFSSVLQFV